MAEITHAGTFDWTTPAQIANETPEYVSWIAEPWIARSSITLLEGQPKLAGKTTFMLSCVSSILRGQLFMERATSMTPVVLLTEERPTTLRKALERAQLLDRHDLHILRSPRSGLTKWSDICYEARSKCKEVGAALMIIDTGPHFMRLQGDTENSAGAAVEAMRPLENAASEGLAVMMLRHERKSGGSVGEAGRGSNAFMGAADIVLSLRRPEGQTRSTIRQLDAVSRFDEIPNRLMVELVSGVYVNHGEEHTAVLSEARTKLQLNLPVLPDKALTMDQIVGITNLGRTTVQQVLQEDWVIATGRGVKHDPYRYYQKSIHSAATNPPGNCVPAESIFPQPNDEDNVLGFTQTV